MGAFTPPPLSAHQGPADFTPPSLDSHQGPAVSAEQPSAASRFLSQLDPRPLVHALLKPSEDPKEDPRVTFGKNTLGVLKDLADRQVEQLRQAKEAYDKGDYTTAIGHGIYGLAPIIGPMGDAAAADFDKGDVASGLGKMAAILGPKALEAGRGAAAAAVDSGLAGDALAAAKGAVVGGAKGAIEPVRYGHLQLPVPAAAAGAGAGGYVAGQLGIPHPIGAAIGGAYPIVKGAIKGAKSELAARAATEAARPVVEAPAPIVAPAFNEAEFANRYNKIYGDGTVETPLGNAPVPEGAEVPKGTPVRPPLAEKPTVPAAAKPTPAEAAQALKDELDRNAAPEVKTPNEWPSSKVFADAQRETEKAPNVATFLHGHGLTADMLERMTPEQRATTIKAMGQNKTGAMSDETVKLAAEHMRRMEAAEMPQPPEGETSLSDLLQKSIEAAKKKKAK